MKLLATICLFFVCLTVQSQTNDHILLKGKVLNDTIGRASLNVVNIDRKKGTITDSEGRFEILVEKGDRVHVSAVQYESKEFIVNEDIFKQETVSFYLIPKITELDEVILSDIDLTGNLARDITLVPQEHVYAPEEFGIPGNKRPKLTAEERRLHTATSSSGGLVPIGALINAISGRTKMLKKHLAVSKLQSQVYRNREKFSDSMYVKTLKIPVDLIEDFVFFICEEKNAINIDKLNKIELLEYFIQESKTYLALKTSEGGQEIPAKPQIKN